MSKRPPRPGLMNYRVLTNYNLLGEKEMLMFKMVLPAAGAGDVIKRELSVDIDGSSTTQTVAGSTREVTGFIGKDNSTVIASLTDIDDAGNRSVPRKQKWTLIDNLPPPQPGEMGVQVTSETDPVPTPSGWPPTPPPIPVPGPYPQPTGIPTPGPNF